MTATNEALMAISDKLTKIKKRAESLSAKTDKFNETIEHIERELRGSGVEFWWKDGPELGLREARGDGADQRERTYAVLGYTKVGGDWCLAVQHHVDLVHEHETGNYEDHLEDGDAVSLRRAARGLRIEAAEHLEAFLDALHDAIASMEEQVEKANAIVAPDEPKKVAAARIAVAGVDPLIAEKMREHLNPKKGGGK